jgi:monoamine oxidase
VHELRLPPDWSIKECDVCIIGAGAAGIQCAESLSKLASPVGSASLSIVLLEGRDRIGGRIKTEMRKHAGGDVAVEHGAAFIHGCDGDGS